MAIILLLIGLITTLNLGSAFGQTNETNVITPDTINITGSITTNTPNQNWLSDPLKFLSHPSIVILVGSTASGLLIALFTRLWEDKQKKLENNRQKKQRENELEIAHNQKEIELKIDLVTRINESVTSIVMASRFEANLVKDPTYDNFEIVRKYQKWEISRAEIKSHLHAYFPNNSIGQDWDRYSDLVEDFYVLATDSNIHELRRRTEKIEDYLSTKSNTIEWNELFSKDYNLRAKSYDELAKQILSQKENLVQLILKKRISTF